MLIWVWTLLLENLGLLPLGMICIILLTYIYVSKKIEIFWLGCYYILALNSLLFLLFFYSDIILIYFLDKVLEPLVVSDPTTFTYNYFYFTVILSFFVSIPFGILLLFYYLSSLNYNYYFLKWICILLVYYLITIFWISKYDLFFANWFSLAYIPQFSRTFDFQPNFELFLISFWSEYEEIFFCVFFLIYIPFFFILYGHVNYFVVKPIYFNLFFFVYFSLIFYFFFEFTFLNNLILYFFFWVIFLLFKFMWLLIIKIKYYKFF